MGNHYHEQRRKLTEELNNMKIQATIQVNIVKRFITKESDFNSFMQQYNEARYRAKTVRKPSEKDVKISNVFRKEMSVSKTANMMGVSSHMVYSALSRVAAYK